MRLQHKFHSSPSISSRASIQASRTHTYGVAFLQKNMNVRTMTTECPKAAEEQELSHKGKIPRWGVQGRPIAERAIGQTRMFVNQGAAHAVLR